MNIPTEITISNIKIKYLLAGTIQLREMKADRNVQKLKVYEYFTSEKEMD